MRDWSKEFNALPKDIRTICCAIDCQTRINQIKIDKDKINKAHKKLIADLNDHMGSCADWLLRL